MSWDEAVEESGGTSLFLKLKDGEQVTGVFLGEPRTFYVKWVNGKPQAAKKGDEGASFRFRTNLVVKDGNQWLPKILEQGVVVYRIVQQLRNTGYELSDTIIRLARAGTGTDTEYSLLPSPKKLTAEDVNALSSVKLNDLSK